jgi:NAD(P) transhydrogenase
LGVDESDNSFDLIVIGGGPAGVIGATTAAACGKRVALIDNHPELGGAGTNTGTVPSKTLRETALAFSGMRSRDLYGVDLSLRREASVSDFLRHQRSVKAAFNTDLAKRMVSRHVSVFLGTAAFEDAHTVRVDDKRLRGEYILIATGSAPVRPPEFPFGCSEIYDSDTILDLDRLPESMAVIGCGTIGSEYACTFTALGTKVHLIDGRDVLMPFLDAELSSALTGAMERSGIVFRWKERVASYGATSTGGVRVTLVSGDAIEVSAVLIAAGRQSNVGTLNLAAAGVASGARGIIAVDDRYRTNVPHILAAGDVIGFPALASTSMEQGRRAVRWAFQEDYSCGAQRLLPAGVYTIPEASMVGETEESLKRAGIDYVVGRGFYNSSARGRIIGDTEGFLKLIFRRADMKLLGVHVIGEQATELVHVGLMAMMTDMGVELLEAACFNVPTLGTLYKTASLDAMAAALQRPGPG